MDEKEAYNHGYNCGMARPDTTNCNFRIFSKSENTKAWEEGKKDAENYKPNRYIDLKEVERRESATDKPSTPKSPQHK